MENVANQRERNPNFCWACTRIPTFSPLYECSNQVFEQDLYVGVLQ